MKLREIERLRAYAVIITVFGHLAWIRAQMPACLTEMIGGVHLFFVISGFVIATSFLKTLPGLTPETKFGARLALAKPALRAFFLRRWFRIIPLSVLWLLIPLAAAPFSRDGLREVHGLIRESGAILLFCYNYAAAYGAVGHRLDPYWSLSVEEQFYLIFPFAMVLFISLRQRLAFSMVGVLSVWFVLRPLIPFGGPAELAPLFAKHATHRNFDLLLIGVALALLRREGWGDTFKTLPKWKLVPWAGCALLAITLLPGVFDPDIASGSGMILQGAFSAILVGLASLDRGLVLEVPGLSRVLEYVGSRSYAIYLSNRFAISFCEHWLHGRGGLFVYAACCAGTTLGLSECSYRIVEQPMIRTGRRWVGRHA